MYVYVPGRWELRSVLNDPAGLLWELETQPLDLLLGGPFPCFL